MPDRLQQIHDWIQAQFSSTEYQMVPASEDASFRRYFRLLLEDKSYIVMDAPPSHERCQPFIDIAKRLRKTGVNVPEILASEVRDGLVLLTDLGNTLYLQELSESTADRLYADAMTALLIMQKKAECDGMPAFDEKALLDEMCLFSNWLLEKHLEIELSRGEQKNLDETYRLLLENALNQPEVFVHRDYHSRNLMVTSWNNPGIIDFQDAVIGPLTYDLVSLLKDCYIKWPREKIYNWATMFYRQLPANDMAEESFLRAFDLMGVQRHLKASGIFARLYHRDGKQGFLKDIPRTLSYIVDLESFYPELGTLASLISELVLPRLENMDAAAEK